VDPKEPYDHEVNENPLLEVCLGPSCSGFFFDFKLTDVLQEIAALDEFKDDQIFDLTRLGARKDDDWSARRRVLMAIDHQLISTPSLETLQKHGHPGRESLGFVTSLHDPVEDYSSWHIDMFVNELDLWDPQVATLAIWTKDVKEISTLATIDASHDIIKNSDTSV
jgi:hypothetical protein